MSMMLKASNSNGPLDIDLSVTRFSNATTSKWKLSKSLLPGFLSPVSSLHKKSSAALASENAELTIGPNSPTGPVPLTSLPHTSIIAHAPGWTLFRNLYMSGGTLLIVTPSNNSFPQLRMMTSPGYPIDNTPENIARREPTAEHMDFLTPEQADQRWKTSSTAYRVWSIKGNTILFNEASQFLHHYFHFVAELLFGTWAFWYGAFTKPSPDLSLSLSFSDAPSPPPIHRLIFTHSDADGWRDVPGFDSYFLRAVFPHVTVEDKRSWADLISSTSARSSDPASHRAWHFPLVLLADRSAASRGTVGGVQTHRIAAEAWQYMFTEKKLIGVHAARWWDPLRIAMWKFAAVDGADALNWMKQSFPRQGITAKADEEIIPSYVRQGVFQEFLPPPQKVTITYITRQNGDRRRLLPEAHDDLVLSISGLVARKKLEGHEWAFRVVDAGRLSRDEQIRVAAETTIMLGIHGNGLTHLAFMPPTRVSTVIEIFYPGGFARDYQWTATAMGMKHFSVWNDTYYVLPAEPTVAYPPGFQESSIPAHGATIAKLIEDRVDGKI
ncbi:hypothetical protein M378DRAFT_16126 [Amanita muscaria Koide BX008]|uniref:Glycosyltransferase 61 catalytic domain-containing protein n=1 Tax=Amanita muscaria (strain Koide BX008) TaxID=946122 RepID=A0A0C2WLN8_AMAMK|nr:hypothetical protein M378DRAFT_16126 [Amanita muscaria Koide BX008]